MNSLRNRLSLALSLVLLVAAGLLAFGLQDFPRRLVDDYVGSRLQHDADLLYARVLDAPDPEVAAQGAAGTVYQLPLSGHYFVIRLGDRVIRSRSLWDEDLPVALPGAGGGFAQRIPGPSGQSLLVFAKRFAGAGAGAGGDITVVVAEDLAKLDAAIAKFRQRLLIGVALALLALLVLQRRLLVRGLAPLDDAVATCRRLERGEFTADAASPESAAPAEIRPMLEALDRLARHHAQRLGRIRHAAGNLSHALKTPLAVLAQGVDELAARGDAPLAASLRAQLDAMRATIERELRRARLAGTGGAPGEPFEARAQLGSLARALEQLHRERGVAIELDVPDRRFPLDREDLLELFGNLLDNACKWARNRVRLSVAPVARAADALEFSVEDDGPGVPDELLDRLGTAGMRVDEQRPGHGLGLAIAGDIVAQYGGAIRYSRSASLGGLRVQASVPLPPG